ncbi:MAG: ribonuclease P protein component [Planctomycetota bacterium]
MKKLSFPKRKRLLHNDDFKAVLAQGQKASNGLITLYVAENTLDFPRLGVSVGKACGNAVVRNRLKRILREIFRQNQHQIPQNFDYLIIVSSKAKLDKTRNIQDIFKRIKFDVLQDSFLHLVNKIVAEKG